MIASLDGGTSADCLEAHGWLAELLCSMWTVDLEVLASPDEREAAILTAMPLLLQGLEHACFGDCSEVSFKFSHVFQDGAASVLRHQHLLQPRVVHEAKLRCLRQTFVHEEVGQVLQAEMDHDVADVVERLERLHALVISSALWRLRPMLR